MKTKFAELLEQLRYEEKSITCHRAHLLPDEVIPLELFHKISLARAPASGRRLGVSMTEYILLTEYKKEFRAWLRLQQ